MGIVKHLKNDANGKLIVVSESKPILDTRQYEVHFNDGKVKEYSYNVFAESIYAQLDDDGNKYCLFGRST